MASITPCRTQISDRFPVAAFVIRVPATRCFEVACTTDPLLLQRAHLHRRDPSNFFTTRFKGLMRAAAGEATVLIPPEQLVAFAGARRIYYALGSYENPRGDGAEFSVDPGVADRVPYVQLSPDFTGRSLERTRLGSRPPSQARWGRGREHLLWGGDMLGVHRERRAEEYDDGFDPKLWAAGRSTAGPRPPALAGNAPRVQDNDPDDPDEPEDDGSIPAYQSALSGAADEYGARGTPRGRQQVHPHAGTGSSVMQGAPGIEPPGLEHPPAGTARPAYGAAFQGAPNHAASMAEPPGLEHPPARSQTWGAPAHDARAPEPPGLEHPPRARASGVALPGGSSPTWGGPTTDWGTPTIAPAPAAEPAGYEDPTEMRRMLGGAQPRSAPHADSYASTRSPTWGSRAMGVGEPSGVRLELQEKARVVRAVFKRRGGLDGYARVATTPETGLSWGMFGFNQRTGTLGEVISAANRRDQEWYADSPLFDQIFGVQDAAELRRFATRETPELRMTPVGQAPLTDPAWLQRFQKAGGLHKLPPEGLGIEPARDPFKLAQNEIAVTVFLEGILPSAATLGFNTDRSLAMLLDRAVDVGPAEAARWFGEAMAAAPAGATLREKLVHAASTAPTEGWGERLRTLAADSTDLYDTIFRLDG